MVPIVLCLAGLAIGDDFSRGHLVVSRVEYLGDPNQFNSPGFSGVQGAVFLDQYTVSGNFVNSLPLPNSTTNNAGITTSFSSHSEGAVMLSVDGNYLTYTGYQAPVGIVGVSNSFTTGAHPASSTGPFFDRVVARIDRKGHVDVSTVLKDTYSGDNARAVISVDGSQFYTVGNASNNASAIGTIGVRYTTLGSNSSIKLGTANPSVPKADNFRAINIFDGQLYVAKGSGSNGNNGIFQVGIGLPTSGGQTITGLPGLFGPADSTAFPYHHGAFFFADPTTLYIADEGLGTATVSPVAGLQKWMLVDGTWKLAYTLQAGLDMGVSKTISGYPALTSTVGLRNLSGAVHGNQVTLYAITAQFSSISGGEPDPTNLVKITDDLSATTLATDESFEILANSGAHEVFRGVALGRDGHNED